MKKTQIPDREEERDTNELDWPQGSQNLVKALGEGDVYVVEKDDRLKTVGSKTTRCPETRYAACSRYSVRCFSWSYKVYKNWGNFTLHSDPKHPYWHCVNTFSSKSFITIIIIIIIITTTIIANK